MLAPVPSATWRIDSTGHNTGDVAFQHACQRVRDGTRFALPGDNGNDAPGFGAHCMTSLQTYRQKRDFARTKEPRGRKRQGTGRAFVVQKHAARALHYDFRLEHDGVLLSWAVPKGPSLDPGVKRLAMQTEDHPVEYGDFEGVIPQGEYGGGTVIVWDRGTWEPEGDARAMYEKGHLNFKLNGEKLKGSYHLVRTQGRSTKDGRHGWLLIKSRDEAAEPGSAARLVEERPESVLSGLTLEDVKKNPERVWSSKARNEAPPAAARTSAARPNAPRAKLSPVSAKSYPGARRAKLPTFVEPELATLVDAAPSGADWLHEIKLDGYRLIARIDDGEVTLSTRRGHDWTARLPSVARALAALPLTSAMIDGELVVLGDDGVSNFQKLQSSLEVGKDSAHVFFAFDLLFLAGYDLRALPLIQRKRLLEERLAQLDAEHGRIRYSAHVAGEGPAFFERACELGLEGSIAKRAESPYVSGRNKAWVKIKCTKRQEFVIGGFTEPSGSRGHFGALLLGVKEGRRLVYAGKVGTGFTAESLRKLWAMMKPLEQAEPPFANPPKGAARRGVHWLSPRLVAEVQFAERTAEGLVRHASFQGLREDKQPDEVRTETAKPTPARRRKAAASSPPSTNAAAAPALDASRIRLTHPERVLYPEQGLTKRDLALYYARVSACMLPHVTGRPIMLVRCPEGAGAQCFHQKHPSKGMPKAVERVLLPEKKGKKEHLMIRDVEGLIGLVQMGALEIHTWGCRAERVECPDQLVFDLDPDAALGWEAVVEAAENVRERLHALGLCGFLKTTGGKGLHVVVPVEPVTPWEEAKEFTRRLVALMVKDEPEKYLMTMTKHKRVGKIFLDYLRNGRGATSVCAFSSRARAGAPVSAPITWEELRAGLRSDTFHVRNMPERLASLRSDPWRELEASRRPIPTHW